MSKVEKLTYDQVAAAADSLTAEGRKATFDAVREKVGIGSFTTIHKHLTAWREAQPAKPKRVRQVPEAVLDALAKYYEQTEAEARAEVEQKLVESTSELAVISTENARLETETETLAGQVELVTAERDKLATKIELQEKTIEDAREKVASLEKAVESAVIEIATARVSAKTLDERDQDNRQQIAQLREEVSKLQKTTITAEQAAAVLQERVTSLQKAAAIEAERTLAVAQAAAEQVKKSEDRANSAAQIAAEQAKKAEDRMEAALSQLRQMQTELNKSRQAEAHAKEHLALLRGKFASARQNKTQDHVAEDEQASIDAVFEKIV